jgi:hypothetical protein
LDSDLDLNVDLMATAAVPTLLAALAALYM